jgi:hypothetical protein
MRILTESRAISSPGDLPTNAPEGAKPYEEVIGTAYRGWVGKVPVVVSIMNNGTMSVEIGGSILALNRDIVDDMKELFGQNSISVAS